ncbi:Cold shock domain-containing protein E1 [Halotydeus destructor]|nr:Cold shock domain-containing protein E1 [Halotydeus destructor]
MMASPHWKPFQTPNNNHDNANTALGRSSNSNSSSFFQSNSSSNNSSRRNDNSFSIFGATGGNNGSGDLSSSPGASGVFKEAGIVEKLLPSYGFIQCCERQARLFFHYSQFQGNIEHLKLGDPVEFEMTYDRRTGKPIASSVKKISSEGMIEEELSHERVAGFITTEIVGDKEGRVAYENRGECFFLPFTRRDVENDQPLNSKDSVTFVIATDNSGNLRARQVTLETPTPQLYQGVICTLKESFGFIERADVVREIFFHSSECKDFKDLSLGDDVEFSIQSRNEKDVAVNVRQLKSGTVVFEDISTDRFSGQITKAIEKNGTHTARQINTQNGGHEPFPGKIGYKQNGIENEIAFGERDLKGEFTIQIGDYVKFNVVTDRRDKLKHASNVELLEESFALSGEHREQGYVTSLKDSYGFIKCLNREGTRIYFRLIEMLDPNMMPKLNDEVEFTVAPDMSSPGRLQAIRIKSIQNGTILKNLLTPKRTVQHMNGCSDYRPDSIFDAPLIDLNSELPQIVSNPLDRGRGPARNDSWSEILSQMEIPISSVNGNGYGHTSDLLASPNDQGSGEDHVKRENGMNGRQRASLKLPTAKGFVAALKDSFGFIENEDHQNEIFFHYSVYDGNSQSLKLGEEVEYSTSFKGGKQAADFVRKIASGTISREEVRPEALSGVVTRSVRCLNPDQDEYSGVIEYDGTMEELANNDNHYEFSMTGLNNIHEFIQKGDEVTFQVGICQRTGKTRAVNIKPIRKKIKANVESIKGNFGFLTYEVDDGKKLFFHISEVKGEQNLHTGDTVEFTIVHNQRTGKYSACAVTKITSEPSNLQRPDRLITKMKSLIVSDDVPRIVLVRQPRGPDGTKGFANRK